VGTWVTWGVLFEFKFVSPRKEDGWYLGVNELLGVGRTDELVDLRFRLLGREDTLGAGLFIETLIMDLLLPPLLRTRMASLAAINAFSRESILFLAPASSSFSKSALRLADSPFQLFHALYSLHHRALALGLWIASSLGQVELEQLGFSGLNL